jgi:hypothetical protein
MGAADASFGVLLDAVSSLQTFVEVFVYVYTILIFAYVLTSWIRLRRSVVGLEQEASASGRVAADVAPGHRRDLAGF